MSNIFYGNVKNVVITQGTGNSVMINSGNKTVVRGGGQTIISHGGNTLYMEGYSISAPKVRNGRVSNLSSMGDDMAEDYKQLLISIYEKNEVLLSLIAINNKLYGMTTNSIILQGKIYPLPYWYHPSVDNFSYTIFEEDIAIRNPASNNLSYLDASSLNEGWVEISQWDLNYRHKEPLACVLEVDVQFGKVEVYKNKSKVTMAV